MTVVSGQIAVVPLGHLMAATVTLNQGPFNAKENVLIITIFTNSGAGSVYAIHIVSAVKLFYKKSLTFSVALLVVVTTQVLGFSWGVLFQRYLVEPSAMLWPQNLVQNWW